MRGFLRFATVALLAIAALFAATVIYVSDETAAPADSTASGGAGRQPDLSQSLTDKGDAPSALVGKAVFLPGQLPASLEGTSVPGGWAKTDSNGSLVPTPELRQLFEYYLAALGEETLPQLVARIEQALAKLEQPARSEAMAILGNYLDYKLAVGELEKKFDAMAPRPEAMQQQMAEIRALRRTWMSARTAEAFFANDEAIDRFQLEQLRIRTDDRLSDGEREQALARAERALPEPIREARRETRKFTDYHKARAEFADDPEALSAWREAHFGEEAARRLEQAEAEQQAWDNKWQAYSEELEELEDLGVAGPEREAAINALRDRYFEGAEKLRAQALDSIR